MSQKDVPVSASRLFDPARDARRLLGWFGLTILMVVAPIAGVLSRQSLFILLPIGVGLLAAAFFISVSMRGLLAFVAALRQPVGVAAAFLILWAGLSLAWTPFAADVAPTFFANAALVAFAALIIAHVPERRALPALYLLPAGVAVTAVATLGMALFDPLTFRGGSEFDASLLERSVITLAVLVWPALGALVAFDRWALAMGLSALVATAIVVSGAQIVMAVFALGALFFALTVDHAPRAGRRAAFVFGVLIVIAPLLPFGLAPLARSVPPVGKSTVAAMSDWRALVAGEPVRLLTGHGLGTATQGVVGGWLPSHTPRTVLFEVWYELGLLGALALAAAFALGFLAAGLAAAHAAPALLAGMVVALSVAVFGVATSQTWFVAVVSLQAVAFGLLCRSSRGGPRPRVDGASDVRPQAPRGAATLPHM